MGVVFAEHLSDDTGRFLMGGVPPNTHITHGVLAAAVNWFEPFTNIGKARATMTLMA
jgi:hypothetical protein